MINYSINNNDCWISGTLSRTSVEGCGPSAPSTGSLQTHCGRCEYVLACARASNLPWEQMKMQLSLSRLRSGLVPLGHLSRHRSAARVQQCMSCDAMVSNLWVHVFGTCPPWKHMRELAHRALALPPSCRSWDVVYAILGVHVNSPAYSCCLVFVDAVVTAANSYKFREPGTQ